MDSVRMMFVRNIKSYFREASLVLLGFVLLVPPPVYASVRSVIGVEIQVSQAQEGEIDLAYLQALAAQGDALMQFALGLMYETGEIGPSDVEAAALYRLAADQGTSPTCCFLCGREGRDARYRRSSTSVLRGCHPRKF